MLLRVPVNFSHHVSIIVLSEIARFVVVFNRRRVFIRNVLVNELLVIRFALRVDILKTWLEISFVYKGAVHTLQIFLHELL